MIQYLDFEKPLAEIEGKAEELRAIARESEDDVDVSSEAAALDTKAAAMLADLYKSLTPWRKCQVARHPDRPHCSAYIEQLFTDYTPLAGVFKDLAELPAHDGERPSPVGLDNNVANKADEEHYI